ncbi:SpoIIE family protein phosphatase [Streptomyces mangrovi]|uniref:SpoIIE family protein phosphatase n=1 Tax=Streptomyces mangrovi TaxID=1206892 RepID=A0ABV9IG44_9ACTN
MTGSAGDERRPAGPPPALLTAAAADALRVTGGRAGGLYLCSPTPGVLRLAVLAGLPGPLFRPWWRVHVDRPFPVAEVQRTGVPVVLANATEAMRRYPQFAAGLPFQFGTLGMPVVAEGRAFGVLTALRPAVADATEVLAERDALARVAHGLATELLRLEAYGQPVTWDDEPVCVRPPAAGPAPGRVGRVGRFSWDPATGTVAADERACALLGLPPGEFPGTLDALARAVDPADAPRLPAALHETAHGTPPPLPIKLRTTEGTLRLLDLWATPGTGSDAGQPHTAPDTAPHAEPGTAPTEAPSTASPAGTHTASPPGTAPDAKPDAAPTEAPSTASPAGTHTASHTTPATAPRPAPGAASDTPTRDAPHTPPGTPPRDAPHTPPGTPPRDAPRTPPGTPPRDVPRTPPRDVPRTPPHAPPGTAPDTTPRNAPHTPPATPPDPTPHQPPAAPVTGVVLDPGPAALAEGAADLLPEGVFCIDRLGMVVYANRRAAHFLGVPHAELVGRSLWDAVPWLNEPACEEHLRGALLSPEPVHFHVRRPADGPEVFEGDWLSLAVHPGQDLLTCTAMPANRVPADPAAPPVADTEVPGPETAASTAPLYRPIVLAIALTEAVTARQVSAVVMQELLPAFGGRRLAIYLLQERHLYLAWENGFPEGFLAPFEGVGLDARLPGVETLTTGRPLFFDSMRQLAAAYPGVPLDAEEGARAFLPLIASGRPVGSCILGFDGPRSFTQEERTVLTALAGLIAHAMEKAQRYDTEAALARGLQQALLPRRLSQHARVETAGRYLPGTEGMDVGGDWYDVVEAGDGLALVIGDVQGHGVQAAATMGQLRSAVRAFALGDRPPEEVMSGTNHLLIDLDPGQFASCCYIRLDPATGRARAARAGHLPPLLRRPDGGTTVVDLRGGVVLGVDPGARYPVTELRLEPGAILALYTDGLVEHPGHDIDDGISALRAALADVGSGPGRSLGGIADRLTATARQTRDRADDIALLLATRPSSPKITQGDRPGPRP